MLRIYSALGGIPYYLAVLVPSASPNENLYRLLAEKNGLLYAKTEYEELFRYLFARDGAYRKVIDTLVEKKYGLSYAELTLAVSGKEKPSGGLMRVLENAS